MALITDYNMLDLDYICPAGLLCLVLQTAAPRRTPLNVKALRMVNVEVPNSKRIEISLQYIYGIGSTTAKAILRETVGRGWGAQSSTWSMATSQLEMTADVALVKTAAASGVNRHRACSSWQR